MQGGGLGAPAAATITFLGGAAGAGGANTAGGFGGSFHLSPLSGTHVPSLSCESEISSGACCRFCGMTLY